MFKKHFLIFLLIASFNGLKSQTKNHHIIGINVDYSTMPKIINARLGTNFTYLYAYKSFCIRTEVGVLPGSNFGTFLKTCLNVGLTSDINKPISLHAVAGIGGMTCNKTYFNNGFEFSARVGNVTTDFGALVRPFHNERMFAGIDIMISAYEVSPEGWIEYHLRDANTYRGLLFFFNFSLNYKLNCSKNKSTT